MGFRCGSCEEEHDGLPMAFHAEEPAAWAEASDELRDRQGSGLGGEDCVLGGERFFLRGLIEIPVHGSDEPLQWGVWVELAAASYARFGELWTVAGRESEPPHEGVVDTALPETLYPRVRGLRARVHTRPVGVRPVIEITAEHPLAEEQRRGISRARLEQIWSALLHQ